MPLPYIVAKPLAPIPPDRFNADGLAGLIVAGGRYGGHWVLNASFTPEEVIGTIETEQDDRPSMAVDTAYVWINDEAARIGLKIVHFESMNDRYPPDQAPYFAAAQFILAGKDWT